MITALGLLAVLAVGVVAAEALKRAVEHLITSAPGLGSGCGIGTAAGTPTPHRSTGSHHNEQEQQR